MADWYDETLEDIDGDSYDNMNDIEHQACMFESQCLGGKKDYTPDLRPF